MQDQIDQIDREAGRLEGIVNSFKETPWQEIVHDIEKNAKELDLRWCFIKEPEKMNEARVTKMAIMYILNLEGTYKQELENKIKEKIDLVDLQDNISKDVDN